MMELIGFPILIAALLGFAVFGDSGGGGTAGGQLDGDTPDPTDGDDDVALTDGNDVFNALGGNDRVEAGGGNDTLDGDAGDDILLGEFGDDVLRGGAGNDSLYGGLGNDTLEDTEGDIFAFGGEGNDVITTENGTGRIGGAEGNDTITTTESSVTILGGAGADVISVTGGDDVDVFGGPGDDLITVNDSLFATVKGDAGDDRVAGVGGRYEGGAGDDVLASFGDFDEDEVIAETEREDPRTALFGNGGDDELWAVQGNTIMTGGAGADEFHNLARSTIEDFTPGTDSLIIDLTFDAPDPSTSAGGTILQSDFEIVLTEIEINGEASTLVETRLAPGASSTITPNNLNQTVWLKGVTPDQLADEDIEINLISEADADALFASVFSNAAPTA